MVRVYSCSFCGRRIEPGIGMMYVKSDGTVLRFCAQKCKKNMLVLRRNPQRLKWTKKYIKVHGQ